MATMLLMLAGACNKYDGAKAEKLVDKYEEKGRFTRAEYEQAVDMCCVAMDDAVKRFTKFREESNDMDVTQTEKAARQLIDDLVDEYPCVDDLTKILSKADKAQMGAKTYDKWVKTNEEFEKSMTNLEK